MLSSLPTISQSFLWHPSPIAISQPELPSTTHSSQHHSQQSRPQPPPRPSRTALSTLLAEEASFAASKERVRKFGAGWLRPPGVSKTLQGMEDERLEREEQEAVANRELALLEEQAAAEQANAAQGLLQGDGAMEIGEGRPVERDLDADVPEAEGDEGWVSSSDEEQEDETTEGQIEVLSVAGQDGGDAMGGQEDGTTRDLDEDVPEAGSYQHTDTDVEDESSELEESPAARWGGTGSAQRPRTQQLGSSLFGSSPVAQRRGRDGGRRSSGRRPGENRI